MMKKTHDKQDRSELIARIVLIFLLVVIALTLGYFRTSIVLAEGSEYSDVLDDLTVDPSFNAEDFPANDQDYSISVIQIAEGKHGELFVYAYQPCCPTLKIKAHEIRMSNKVGEGSMEQDYALEFCSSSGTLFKYRVKNFEVKKEDRKRYYGIVQITRLWDVAIDGDQYVNGNKILNKPYKVGQLWTTWSNGEKVHYSMEQLDVIEVTAKYVGTLEYSYSGAASGVTHHYVTYVAFSTDISMDRLLEATLWYEVTFLEADKDDTHWFYVPRDVVASETKTFRADDTESFTVGSFWGWSTTELTWTAIESVPHFMENENLYNPEEVADKDWVIRFWSGDIYYPKRLPCYDSYSATATILHLTYVKDGIVYDMGVVDNKQVSDGWPDNYTPVSSSWSFWTYLLLILAIILFILLLPFIIKLISAFICWIISLYSGNDR